MQIQEFVWPRDRIDHITRHGVSPIEFEEVCFGRPLVQRAKSEGQFQDDLEEITDPIFGKRTCLSVSLPSSKARAIERIARAKGVSQDDLIREWILQELANHNGGHKRRETKQRRAPGGSKR